MTEKDVKKRPARRGILRTPWPWFIVSIALLVAVAVVVLPHAIRYGIQRAFVAGGAERATVEDVEFNPFTRTLVVHGLRVDLGAALILKAREVSMRFDWAPLWRKQLKFEHVSVRDATMTIEGLDGLRAFMGGLTPSAGEVSEQGAPAPWGLWIGKLKLTGGRVQYLGPDPPYTMGIFYMELTGLDTMRPEKAIRIYSHGRLNDGTVRLRARVAPFSPVPGIRGRVFVSGFSLAPFARLAEPHLAALDGKLDMDVKIEAALEDGLTFEQEGLVTLKQFKAGFNAGGALQDIEQERLAWEGSLKVAVAEGGTPRVSAAGRLEGARSVITIPGRGFRLLHAGARWEGGVEYAEGFALKGDLKVDGFRAESTGLGLSLLGTETIELRGLSVEGTEDKSVVVGEARLTEMYAGRGVDGGEGGGEAGGEPLLSAAGAVVRGVELSRAGGVSTGPVELRDATVLLSVGPEGRWRILDDMLARGGAAGALSIRVAGVELQGKSRMTFEDLRHAPPYRATLHLTEARLEGLDSSRPDKPGTLVLTGRVGKYTEVSFKGHVQPFAERLSLDLTGSIKTLDLPPLTPYTSRHLGYGLKSGHMDAEIKVKILKGELDSTAELSLNNLEAVAEDKEKTEKLEQELGMPLDAALALLRDEKNNVALKLSVQGDITDPKLNLSDAVNRALGKAMKKAAASYLKYYFQPYGTFIVIGEFVGGLVVKAARVRLDPVFFSPGSAGLDVNELHYLERVAGLLKDRPGVRVKLCGKVVKSDSIVLGEIPEVEKKLQTLANERASAIKDHMVDLHGVGAERLFLCQPEIDESEGARARVELLL